MKVGDLVRMRYHDGDIGIVVDVEVVHKDERLYTVLTSKEIYHLMSSEGIDIVSRVQSP